MDENSLDTKYQLLLKIHRAAHFEWLHAVKKLMPACDVKELILAYWDEVARDTAYAYLHVLNKTGTSSDSLCFHVASLIVKSSLAMGESASLIQEGENFIVQHTACPWWEWHKKEKLENLDQPGCDVWFTRVVQYINESLGSKLKVTTEASIPAGDSCCRRVFSLE